MRVWDEATIETWADRLRHAGAESRSPGLRRNAHEIAVAFEAVGQALAFADDEHDGDLVSELLARLEHLRADAMNVLSFIAPSLIADESIDRANDDEVTVIRQRGTRRSPPRIVPPVVASRTAKVARENAR